MRPRLHRIRGGRSKPGARFVGKNGVVLQSHGNECGVVALKMILQLRSPLARQILSALDLVTIATIILLIARIDQGL